MLETPDFAGRSAEISYLGPPVPQVDSTPKIIVSTVVSFDMFCTGKDTGELVTPDDQSQAIFLAVGQER